MTVATFGQIAHPFSPGRHAAPPPANSIEGFGGTVNPHAISIEDFDPGGTSHILNQAARQAHKPGPGITGVTAPDIAGPSGQENLKGDLDWNPLPVGPAPQKQKTRKQRQPGNSTPGQQQPVTGYRGPYRPGQAGTDLERHYSEWAYDNPTARYPHYADDGAPSVAHPLLQNMIHRVAYGNSAYRPGLPAGEPPVLEGRVLPPPRGPLGLGSPRPMKALPVSSFPSPVGNVPPPNFTE